MHFIQLLEMNLEEFENNYIIIGGDFNMYFTELNMADNKQLNLNTSKTMDKLMTMMSKYDLIDIWRFQNEKKRHFTWKRETQKSKIDYFFRLVMCS